MADDRFAAVSRGDEGAGRVTRGVDGKVRAFLNVCVHRGGRVVREACGTARHHLAVERTLPIFPMTQDMAQLWHPTPDTRAQLMRRLEEELLRRGQPVPTVPETRPPPSEGYRRRLLRMGKSIEGEKAPPKRG